MTITDIPGLHGQPEGEGPRRFLIATAVSRYPKCPAWDRPGLVQARESIIELFTGRLGYRHQTALGLDPSRAQLTDQLRAFCKSADRREDDLVAVYVSGHGEVLEDGGDHVLYTSDTDPEDTAYTSLPTVELARAMLRDTPVRRLLLMLDTCYSGQGGNKMTAAALERINGQWRNAAGSGLVIISSAQSHEQAKAGAFPRLFTDAVDSWATAGHGPDTLSVSTVVEHMNRSRKRPGHQRINLTLVGLSGEPPAFLANPRRNSGLTGVDLAIQHAAEFDAQARRRDTELTTRLLMRAMGSSDPRLRNWWFSGRQQVLAELAAWLGERGVDGNGGCRVVTAGPGSGKTAVLGLIAALSHPEHRLTVPARSLGLSERLMPDAGSVDVAMYAQSLTNQDVLAGLAAAAGLRVNTVGEFLEALQAQKRPRPFTALIDALDEAATPDSLCSQIVRPLLHYGNGNVRLLLGTRPYLLDCLGLTPGTPAYREQVIDLDDPRYADPEALQIYTIRNLLDSQPRSPYRQHSGALREVAQAVREAAGNSFLVARITAGTLAAADTVVEDPADPAWRATLPRHAGTAMRNDLTRRLGNDAQRATDLLRPLAFALGQGLPWEDIWAPLASEISGRHYTNADLMWLRRNAGAYVVEATEAGRSAYRLYHQALVEHLRDGIDPTGVHAAYMSVLIQAVPYRPDGTRDWSRAHPYTLAYLASHAAATGRLDELLDHDGYLVHALPRSLTPHLHHLRSETALVYRSSVPLLMQATPDQRRQILATGAASAGATSLHERLTHDVSPGAWTPRWATGGLSHPALRDTFTGHTDMVTTVASAVLDGAPVAVTGSGSTVRVWDLTTGQQIGEPLTVKTPAVVALACTVLDGTPVAVTGGNDGTVRVWDLTTRQQIGETLTGHTRDVRAVACTDLDGTPVAVTGHGDGTVRVWDLTTSRQIGETLTGHTSDVRAVACTDLDGTPVAVTSSGGTVRVWDLTTRQRIGETLTGPTPGALAVACTVLDGTPVFVTGSWDSTVRVWDLATCRQIGEPLTGHPRPVSAVACTDLDGTPIAVTGSHDGTVRVWDLTTSRQIGETLTGHTSDVRAVACIDLDGTPLAVTASSDHIARLWDLTVGSLDMTISNSLDHTVRAVACTALEGTPVAVTGGDDGAVRVWDLATGQQIGEPLTSHPHPVSAVACTVLDGTPVAVTSQIDGAVRVWDLATGQQIGEPLTGHPHWVTAVACTDLDGTPVAVIVTGTGTGTGTGTMRVWDVATGQLIGESLDDHTGWVHAVACTVLDGMPVAVTGGDDGRVRVWDLATCRQIGEPLTGHTHQVSAGESLDGHTGWLRAVACTVLDGTPVAVTGHGNGTVRVWDLTTCQQIGETLTGKTPAVVALACTVLDGTPVAVTGHGDGTVRVWDLTTGDGNVLAHHAPSFYLSVVWAADDSLFVAADSHLVLYQRR
ncbi:WD40 repeat protein [Streptomyces sp. SAI-208]|uniref:caspase family protein n=1 Tax=Streptomyces sp. SAI-208 TaxID=2940550 RepID=UPI002475C026|nr:caspase family protein [Streptomyces sp. SAI-208]MDH6604471.1 WD40 repeat protein [Streptomyces sp. SAI-208]